MPPERLFPRDNVCPLIPPPYILLAFLYIVVCKTIKFDSLIRIQTCCSSLCLLSLAFLLGSSRDPVDCPAGRDMFQTGSNWDYQGSRDAGTLAWSVAQVPSGLSQYPEQTLGTSSVPNPTILRGRWTHRSSNTPRVIGEKDTTFAPTLGVTGTPGDPGTKESLLGPRHRFLLV